MANKKEVQKKNTKKNTIKKEEIKKEKPKMTEKEEKNINEVKKEVKKKSTKKEYDKLYKMPTDVRSIYNVEKDAQDIVNMDLSETYDNNEVILKVDKYINDFAKAVIGATVNVDNIKAP